MTQAKPNRMPDAWLVPRLKPIENMSYGRTDQSLTVDLQAGVHWYPETTCDPDKGVTDRYGVTYFPKRLVVEPDLPFERIRASLSKRGFNTFEGDDVDADRAAHKETFLRAAYYTWLREQHWSDSHLFVVAGGKDVVKIGVVCPSGNQLDTMIAEAIAKEKEKQ